MANVMLAARTATADTFNVISSTTTALSRGANSVAVLAEVAEIHAQNYRDAAIDNREEYKLKALDNSTARLTEHRIELEDRLNADERFKATFAQIAKERSERNAKRQQITA